MGFSDGELVVKALKILLVVAISSWGAWARASQERLLFVDPKSDRSVPVYDVRGERVTLILPGEMITLKGRRADGWYVVKARSADGKDLEFFIDPKALNDEQGRPLAAYSAPRSRVIKLGEGREGSVLGIDEPGMDPVICAFGAEKCVKQKPGSDIEVEEAILTIQVDPASSKPRWTNYYRAKGHWYESDDTRNVDPSWSLRDDPPEDCPPPSAAVSADDKKALDELLDTLTQTGKVGAEQQLDKILAVVGACESMGTPDYKKAIVDKLARRNLPPLVKQKRSSAGVETAPATKADWVAIDVMARTLYAEMASCFKHGAHYPEAVAKIAVNRADFVSDPQMKSRASLFVNASDTNPLHAPLTKVFFRKGQFSVWNKDDPARRMTMCPPSNAAKDFWAGHPPTPDESKIWREAVRIASEAVLSGESFRRRTKDMTSVYYNVNQDLSEQGYKRVRGASVGGDSLSRGRCIQVWNHPDVKWRPTVAAIYSEIFVGALKGSLRLSAR